MILQEDIADKILKGCQLAIDKLIEKKIKDNAYLVVSENGKVVKVKAADLKK